MYELICNLHMHTRYSDGNASHAEIAHIALQTGVDVVIVTDHNVWAGHKEGYFRQKERTLLLLVGEEVHNPSRLPQKNHMLIFGAGRELAPFGEDPQTLINQANRSGGLTFLAHPIDPELPPFNEPDISWEDWSVRDFTGIELWNGFSELKIRARSKWQAVILALNPRQIAEGPHPQVLKHWDAFTAVGQKVVAVGGSDAHALPMHLGPIHRTIFPYAFHFAAVNTHLFTPRLLGENLPEDRKMVLEAFRRGHAFIGYDLPAPTRGFQFTAHGEDGDYIMGDDMLLHKGVTLQIKLPQSAEGRLLCNGEVIKTWKTRPTVTHVVTQPGAYRVEAYLEYLGKLRGWIFSNPIYIRKSYA